MTRDIIRMAREADLGFAGSECEMFGGGLCSVSTIERFAALVAAAEREKLAAWMIERSYATGHGDTIEDLLVELEWQVREAERESLAAEAERNGNTILAKQIRARGNA